MGRKRGQPDLKGLLPALRTIDLWERRVCYSTVTVPFTAKEFMEYCYPAEVLDILYRAKKVSRAYSYDDYVELGEARITIDCDTLGILTPHPNHLKISEDKFGIMTTIVSIRALVEEWNVVRRLAVWFNDYATPACARYYLPALGNFLPAGHLFHTATASSGRTPTLRKPISEISEDIRNAAETINMALFCPHKEDKQPAGLMLEIQTSYGKSQSFYL